jgi:hypothetical protein
MKYDNIEKQIFQHDCFLSFFFFLESDSLKMLPSLVATFVLIVTTTDGRVLLYSTENEEAVEKFDCVYFVPFYGDEIPYCRRLGGKLITQSR